MTCRVRGCNTDRVVARGLCNKHYHRWRRFGRPDARVHRHERHGGKRTPEYKIWQGMRRRCADKTDPLYGGRGIRVCSRWERSFSNFLTDMGRRPSARHSIDRFPNVNGNYEPGNCRWATAKQQANNRRARPIETYVSGERSAWCTIASSVVSDLRTARAREGLSFQELSARFGLSKSQAHRICHNQSRVHDGAVEGGA